ncbi:MAG TPA: hypothetical protein VGQ68_08095 [Gaiellaceae bacterium]|jgi:hypothetical protein|nr:hypothetical protein [Gaiellaceae bacterium]
MDDWWTAHLPERRQASPELYDPASEPKGWQRLSIKMRTHPLHPLPDIGQPDLLLPTGADRLLLLGACLVCGACLSVFWVYLPLFMVTVLADVSLGSWLWLSMGGMTLASGLLLFSLAVGRERKYPETL